MDPKALLWSAIFSLLLLFVGARARRRHEPMPWMHLLFFGSGFPALIYQIVWQRALFAIYGVNIESVTIVVSAFMLGLGLGSLLGGALSKRVKHSLLLLFGVAELGTAAFGMVSLRVFQWVAEFTAGAPLWQAGLLSFGLVVIPTVLMGATLPLLVEYVVSTSQNVGSAVGGLYFVNTLGSAAACFVAGDVLMRLLGESGSVHFAAAINIFVGVAVVALNRNISSKDVQAPGRPDRFADAEADPTHRLLPFPLALACAAFAGFLALSYEIIWYRMLAFASGGKAQSFAFLLGAYLLGVAAGSRLIERFAQGPGGHDRAAAQRRLGWILLASAIVSFVAGPAFAYLLHFASSYTIGGATIEGYVAFLPFIGVGALLFGATFPLVSHVSVLADERAGSKLSYLYAANIVGSTLGSFVVGFILMDHFSLGAISAVLLAGGIVFASVVLLAGDVPKLQLSAGMAGGLIAAILAVTLSQPVFASIYDRLLFKRVYPRKHFLQLVETRSGAVGVTPDGTAFGGGVYDGHFNTGLVNDVNLVVRAYAVSAFHPAPRHVLVIGLASGSWAQVIAANPAVEEMTIVEINSAYLQLIPEYPEVASLLHNPKVHITIDDGRRWLLHNRQARFDVIVMNTTFHWRDHSTNLLSADFLRVVREHLNAGGVLFYNPTGSKDVMATGLSVFPYALRVVNCLVLGDTPIVFDKDRWKKVLEEYSIDGRRVFNLADPKQKALLDYLVAIPDDPTGTKPYSIETNAQLRRRLPHGLIITDDNMGAEWVGN